MHPAGETHPKAKLTDAEVDLMRSLYEDDGISLGTLSVVFETPKDTVRRICNYERRNVVRGIDD